MMRRFGMVLALLLAAAMMMSAQAMPVHIEEGTLAVTATNTEDASSVELDVADFELIGKDETGDYLVFADGQYLKVSRNDLQAVIAGLGALANTLPSITDYEELKRGSKGAAVEAMQTSLVAQGYTTSKVDGDFGGSCQRAVSAFQRAKGLKQTGVADPMTQMHIFSSEKEVANVTPVLDPEVMFAPIIGKTEVNLDSVIEMGLTLDYDDIAGEGMMSNGNSIFYDVPVANDIDKCAFDITFGLYVKQGDDGIVEVTPAAKLECTCVRRPVMEEILLKSGDERRTQPVYELKSSLSGVKSIETALVLLDEETVDIVANAAEEGELKLRVNCKYNTYDIAVPTGTLEALSSVAKAAQGL